MSFSNSAQIEQARHLERQIVAVTDAAKTHACAVMAAAILQVRGDTSPEGIKAAHVDASWTMFPMPKLPEWRAWARRHGILQANGSPYPE